MITCYTIFVLYCKQGDIKQSKCRPNIIPLFYTLFRIVQNSGHTQFGGSLMKKYIKMMRLDHWIKQLFIIPGICFAFLLYGGDTSISVLVPKLILGFIATSLIASANYEINEYLDREFDRFHPIKKNRTAASEEVNGKNRLVILGDTLYFRFIAGLDYQYPVLFHSTLAFGNGNSIQR